MLDLQTLGAFALLGWLLNFEVTLTFFDILV